MGGEYEGARNMTYPSKNTNDNLEGYVIFRAPSYPPPTLCYEPVNLQKHKLQYIWVQMVPPPKKNQKVIYNIYINTFQGD